MSDPQTVPCEACEFWLKTTNGKHKCQRHSCPDCGNKLEPCESCARYVPKRVPAPSELQNTQTDKAAALAALGTTQTRPAPAAENLRESARMMKAHPGYVNQYFATPAPQQERDSWDGPTRDDYLLSSILSRPGTKLVGDVVDAGAATPVLPGSRELCPNCNQPRTGSIVSCLDEWHRQPLAPLPPVSQAAEEQTARIFVQKWADHFAAHGTGYVEHLGKDNEAVSELQALIAAHDLKRRKELEVAIAEETTYAQWVLERERPRDLDKEVVRTDKLRSALDRIYPEKGGE